MWTISPSKPQNNQVGLKILKKARHDTTVQSHLETDKKHRLDRLTSVILEISKASGIREPFSTNGENL